MKLVKICGLLSGFFILTGFWLSLKVNATQLEVVAGEPMSGDVGGLDALGTGLNNMTTIENEVMEGVITEIVSQTMSDYSDSQVNLAQEVQILITKGSQKGTTIELHYNRLLTQGERPLHIGDQIFVNRSTGPNSDQELYYVIDFIRTPALFWLFIIFVLMVLIVGRWQGFQSLLGMGLSFVILFSVLIPGIKLGYDPLLVTIVASAMIMLLTFYMSHGFNQKTTWALLGTLISLLITAFLAKFFIHYARLTGFAAEEAIFLQYLKGGTLNIQGILLAGIIVGALGVLDDITISQSSIVYELKHANPKLRTGELFFRAMRVGRDHISSLANTLVLVYAGSALPLLLVFTLDESRSMTTILSYEVIAEEVVRTLVGSIGLITAVPLTTFLAAKYGFKSITAHANGTQKKGSTTTHHHHHLK